MVSTASAYTTGSIKATLRAIISNLENNNNNIIKLLQYNWKEMLDGESFLLRRDGYME